MDENLRITSLRNERDTLTTPGKPRRLGAQKAAFMRNKRRDVVKITTSFIDDKVQVCKMRLF